MGHGLFAAKDIPQGTRMVSESPILELPTSVEDDLEAAFCDAWHGLPVENRRKLDQLSWNPSLLTQATRDNMRRWYKETKIAVSTGETLRGKRLKDALKAMTKRYAIFLTNRVEMGHGAAYGSGLFPFYSRGNHSCIPNSHNAYNPTIGQLTIQSTRQIRAGEQLFLSYIDGACRTNSQRQKQLNNWGFTCKCQACTDESIGQLRRRMFDIDQGLAAYESPFAQSASRGNSPLAPAIARLLVMPRNESEALSFSEELARLLQQQGLYGMELCKTYVRG